ncbi:hypothetical protein CR513_54763, partial [Mucuna pruriens]
MPTVIQISASSSAYAILLDSQIVIHIILNPVFHECTKHIEVNCHYIRDEILNDNIATMHLVDILDKVLGKQQFDFLLGRLNIQDPHAPI